MDAQSAPFTDAPPQIGGAMMILQSGLRPGGPAWRASAPMLCAVVLAALASGCSHIPTRNSGIAAGVLAAAHMPTTQLQQVYYLGVFDPRDQVPPTIYRVRIQGQASLLNSTNFASGWVHASVLDSLSSSTTHEATLKELGGKGGNGKNGDDKSALTGRRLIMFGPEGFREAPKDHRLVVVMGSDPSAFFSSIDRALGVVAEATQGATAGPELTRLLLEEQALMRDEEKKLAALAQAAGGAK
jgi:hypothetical protein